MARVIFVNGFNRSGTTLVTAAVTDATGATTLTVGDLARHLPSVDSFLGRARKRATPPDRGVDRLPVTESTPEEYCWLLHARTGEYAFGDKAVESGVLPALVDELAGDGAGAVVVLKNPWDTGRERLLLDHVDNSRILLVRRRIGAIESSMARAWERLAGSNGYLRALIGDRRLAAELIAKLLNPETRQELIRDSWRNTRGEARRLARGVADLPLDRVAYLSYEELREDPQAGAAWAAHVVDPVALGKAVAAHTFPEFNRADGDGDTEAREIDGEWASAWQQARARQIEAGILPRPR